LAAAASLSSSLVKATLISDPIPEHADHTDARLADGVGEPPGQMVGFREAGAALTPWSNAATLNRGF
jgi:hypothetical protein